MNFEIVISERKNQLILYKSFKFYNKAYVKYLDAYKWQCVNKKCTAKIYVDRDMKMIVKDESLHNHENEPESVRNKKKFSNQLKRKCEDELERPSKMINNEIQKYPQQSKLFTGTDVNNIYQCLYRSRRSSYPKLPKTIYEVIEVMKNRKITTIENEDFLLDVDSTNNILFYSTISNLKLLCSCDKIFVDGTFYSCPKYFYQLFTIHIFKNGHYVPLSFFLLPDKSANTYASAFRCVVEKCSSKNLHFNPTTLIADFEEAIHVGAKFVWPQIKIIGCRFHLTQSWWRHIQNFGNYLYFFFIFFLHIYYILYTLTIL